MGYVKLEQFNPGSRRVKPECSLEPRYRWYDRPMPEHLRMAAVAKLMVPRTLLFREREIVYVFLSS